MIHVVDVEHIDGYKLFLKFSDGFAGVADLSKLFESSPLNQFADNFLSFSLTDTLCWGDDTHIAPEKLREITEGTYYKVKSVNPNDPIEVITQAFRESLEEGDSSILKAALKNYADETGFKKVIDTAKIKSRSSAYRSLSDTTSTSPRLDTILSIGNAISELVSEASKQH